MFNKKCCTFLWGEFHLNNGFFEVYFTPQHSSTVLSVSQSRINSYAAPKAFLTACRNGATDFLTGFQGGLFVVLIFPSRFACKNFCRFLWFSSWLFICRLFYYCSTWHSVSQCIILLKRGNILRTNWGSIKWIINNSATALIFQK